MDSESIEAIVLGADGSETRTPGTITKAQFAPWLMEVIEQKAAAFHFAGRGS